MPGWQVLHDELAAEGFTVVVIALDASADAIAPFLDGVTYPVLLDSAHLSTELLSISNVPTALWVDENGVIVRGNAAEFGTDTFVEFHGIDSQWHADAVRRWVRFGEVPDDSSATTEPLAESEVEARLHFRLADHLASVGDTDGADQHLAAAVELAPLDFTIARAAMPRRGTDPFGTEFFELYERWQAAGSPFHGVTRRPQH